MTDNDIFYQSYTYSSKVWRLLFLLITLLCSMDHFVLFKNSDDETVYFINRSFKALHKSWPQKPAIQYWPFRNNIKERLEPVRVRWRSFCFFNSVEAIVCWRNIREKKWEKSSRRIRIKEKRSKHARTMRLISNRALHASMKQAFFFFFFEWCESKGEEWRNKIRRKGETKRDARRTSMAKLGATETKKDATDRLTWKVNDGGMDGQS